MGKLKRLRRTIVVDSDSDSDDDVDFGGSPVSSSSKKDSLPRSRKKRPVAALSKKAAALKAELADLLDNGSSSDDDDGSEDSFVDSRGSSEGSDDDDDNLDDLTPTSEEESESEEEGQTKGAIIDLTEMRRSATKARATQGSSRKKKRTKTKTPTFDAVGKKAIGKKKAKARSNALTQLKARRRGQRRGQSRRDLSSSEDENDEDEDASSSSSHNKPKTRRTSARNRNRTTKKPKAKATCIDLTTLEEAARGHALASSDDEDDSDTPPTTAGVAEDLPLDGGIVIPALLAQHLRHHQIEGIKFMHRSVVVENNGCVLAHCMGLGKTLQAVALVATLLATEVEWEGDDDDDEEEEEDTLGGEPKRMVKAMEMNVVDLRTEVKKRGVDIKKVKKKELAEILERKWEEEAKAEAMTIATKKATEDSTRGESANAIANDGMIIDVDSTDEDDKQRDEKKKDQREDEDETLFDDCDQHLKNASDTKERRPRTALIVCPINVLLNWEAEFEKWLGTAAPLVYSLHAAGTTNAKRAAELQAWIDTGGVMICGYDQYRNLTAPTRAQNEAHRRVFQQSLVRPGPGLLVCDEGHVLRNAKSGMSRALDRIRCRRRIVLTGTPLQNNLSEYHCMIDFVRKGLLSSHKSFQQDFVRVIEKGRCEDSTAADVRLMKQRAHVLHGLLKVCVHRADLKVLERYLPPKREYALKVRMSPLQIQLYRNYLLSKGLATEAASGDGGGVNATSAAVPKQAKLFEAYTELAKIWTHPGVLQMDRKAMAETAKERDVKEYDSIDDFVCESSDEDWSDDAEAAERFDRTAMAGKGHKRKKGKKKKQKGKKKQSLDCWESSSDDDDDYTNGATKSAGKQQSNDDHDSDSDSPIKDKKPPAWWDEIMSTVTSNNTENPELSGKMLVMLQILKEAAASKEKVLLFSQSLLVLELIERVLETGADDGRRQRWKLGRDYFRLDGSTASKTRQGWVERFNDRRNRRARLFLISTKAGGLGVNLSTATRVVIFDAAWNPSVDAQAVFRAFRFGQTKPVFVYRLLAAGTMEEKIYHRQVTKNALASRVLDKEQKNRHFKEQELVNLYDFDPEGVVEKVDASVDDENSDVGVVTGSSNDDDAVGVSNNQKVVRDRIQRFKNCTDAMPSDPVLVRLLGKMQPKWLLGYADHDALATGEGETELSTEEEAVAWAEYEAARKAQEGAEAALQVGAVNGNGAAADYQTLAGADAALKVGAVNGAAADYQQLAGQEMMQAMGAVNGAAEYQKLAGQEMMQAIPKKKKQTIQETLPAAYRYNEL